MTSWTRELDEAVVLATKCGHWHVVLFYLLCGLAAIPTSFLVFSQVFTNATPEHWCALPPDLEALGLPEDLRRSLTLPGDQKPNETCRAYQVDMKEVYRHPALSDFVEESLDFVKENDRYVMVKRFYFKTVEASKRGYQISNITDVVLSVRSKDLEPCKYGWSYDTEHYHTTLVTHFSLVCDQEWLPPLCNTLFWVGSIFGNLIFGWMSDRWGRRPTILLMIFLVVPINIAASFPSTYWSYIVLRVFGGLFFPALYQQPFILALELMPPSRRTYTGIVVGMLFAAGMCLLALLAFLLRDWFYLSLVTSLPFLPLFAYYWIIPESPRWLVGRGRVAEAEKVLRKLAKKNGIQLARGFIMELHKKIRDEEDVQIEARMLTNINGHVVGIPQCTEKEYIDRRLSNMLTFKPDVTKVNEPETRNLERIIALEVAEIVNRKSCKLDKDSNADDNIIEEGLHEESLFTDCNQKATQTDAFERSPVSTLRRKSLQLVNKLFKKSEEDEDNKRMDDQYSEGDGKASILDIWRYPNIRKKFLISTFDWVALGVVYNSLSYNSPNLGVDDYLAFFIGGAVEIPSYVIAWRCMDRFGRRWVLCTFICIGGLSCLSCVFVPEAWPWVTVTLAMLGRLCVAASFAVFYVMIGELLPTVLRAQAIGAASFVAGLGLLTCPYIVYLAVYSRSLPLVIMGVLSIACGITSLYLPETLNQPLPQTLEDGERFGSDFKVISCVKKPKNDDGNIDYDA